MQDTKRMWAWVGGIIVVFAIAAYFVWPGHHASTPVASGPTPVYATQGQLVGQFPQSFILGGNVAINNSYSIAYSSSTNLSTAIFTASTSIQRAHDVYRQYFLSKNWTITNDVNSGPTSRSLYAVTSSSDVSVTIVASGTASTITIGYQTN